MKKKEFFGFVFLFAFPMFFFRVVHLLYTSLTYKRLSSSILARRGKSLLFHIEPPPNFLASNWSESCYYSR